jgi:hypothetical protein
MVQQCLVTQPKFCELTAIHKPLFNTRCFNLRLSVTTSTKWLCIPRHVFSFITDVILSKRDTSIPELRLVCSGFNLC